MARFDPMTYPDRIAFHANARRIRATELAKLADAMTAWLAEKRAETRMDAGLRLDYDVKVRAGGRSTVGPTRSGLREAQRLAGGRRQAA